MVWVCVWVCASASVFIYMLPALVKASVSACRFLFMTTSVATTYDFQFMRVCACVCACVCECVFAEALTSLPHTRH